MTPNNQYTELRGEEKAIPYQIKKIGGVVEKRRVPSGKVFHC
jgi:hypothetical protein